MGNVRPRSSGRTAAGMGSAQPRCSVRAAAGMESVRQRGLEGGARPEVEEGVVAWVDGVGWGLRGYCFFLFRLGAVQSGSRLESV